MKVRYTKQVSVGAMGTTPYSKIEDIPDDAVLPAGAEMVDPKTPVSDWMPALVFSPSESPAASAPLVTAEGGN